MRFRTLATLFFFVAGLAIAPALGGEKKTPKTKPKEKKEEEVPTFTTDDLERKYGKSAKPKTEAQPAGAANGKNKPASPKAPAPDPLAQLQASQQAKREKTAQRAEAQQRVQAAQAKVTDLEKRLASLRNPYLARSQPSDEEKEAWKGKDQAGRLRVTEENLAQARSELEQARADLNELR